MKRQKPLAHYLLLQENSKKQADNDESSSSEVATILISQMEKSYH